MKLHKCYDFCWTVLQNAAKYPNDKFKGKEKYLSKVKATIRFFILYSTNYWQFNFQNKILLLLHFFNGVSLYFNDQKYPSSKSKGKKINIYVERY